MKNATFMKYLFVGLLALSLLCSGSAQAQEYRYRYVSLDEVAQSNGFTNFDASVVKGSGRVYGTVYDDAGLPRIAIYAHGALTVLEPIAFFGGVGYGAIGASLLIDPENFVLEPALLRGNKVEPLPCPPDVFLCFFGGFAASGDPLVDTFDADFNETLFVYDKGQLTPYIPVQPPLDNFDITGANKHDIVCGRTVDESGNHRGFWFNRKNGELKLLDPLATEPHSWAMDINNRDQVLGYSFSFSGIERIGVWSREGKFKTYFVEGTPEFPTISNRLLFNDNNLILITLVTSPAAERDNTYLVPKPGVRYNLADLVENLPAGPGPLWWIVGLNNHGDIIGFNRNSEDFLLERIGADN